MQKNPIISWIIIIISFLVVVIVGFVLANFVTDINNLKSEKIEQELTSNIWDTVLDKVLELEKRIEELESK